MTEKYPKIAVDIIVDNGDSGIVIVKRKNDPFKGKWALPGGFINTGETVEQAAERELREETGLKIELEGLLGVYSNPERDPRGHVISIVMYGKEKGGKLKTKTDETDDALWLHLNNTDRVEFGFDHAIIVEDYKIIQMMAKEAEEETQTE